MTIAISHAASFVIAAVAGWALPPSAIRAARATLLERHVTPVGDIESGGGQSWAYFKDGEGNLFEIVQRLDYAR